MRRVILALLLAGFASVLQAAPADDIASRLNARLEKTPVIRADFEQAKTMAAFKTPLLTRGRLVFTAQQGVLWQIDKPLKLTYVLQEDRIVEIDEDGAIQVRTSKDLPGMAQVGRIFRGLLGGQTQALGDLFDSRSSGDPERAWSLVLTPRNAQVGQFIGRIELTGGRHLESIRITEASGDSSTIRFSRTQEAGALSPEEQKLLSAK